MSDVAQRIKKVVVDTLKVDLARVIETAHFVQDLGATSIQSIELVAAFEEEFDIEMDPDEATAVKTVAAAIDFIADVVKEQHG